MSDPRVQQPRNPYAPGGQPRALPHPAPPVPRPAKFQSAASRLTMGFAALIVGLAISLVAQYEPFGVAAVASSANPWAVFMLSGVVALWGVGNIGWGMVLVARRVDWLYQNTGGQ